MRENQAAKLKRARQKAGLTQVQVAKAAKISESCYQRCELGIIEPRVCAANRIAKTLDSTVEELFGT